jgi:hypothetical protein
MSMYSVRVQLEGASWDDYIDLDQYLSSIGIIDVITGDSGVRYKMSPGEYNYAGSKTFDQIYSDVVACVRLVAKKPFAVTVAQVTQWQWVGLQILI